MIGRLRGRDPELGREAVVYTATLDNASGVAALLAIAEAFAALPQRPRRSILFAAVGRRSTASSARTTWRGTLRCRLGRLAANINIDGVNIWGRTRDVPVVGLGKSTLDDWIRAIAETQGRVVLPEAFPDKGPTTAPTTSASRAWACPGYLDAGTEVLGSRRAGAERQPGRRRTTTSRATTSPPSGTSRARSRTRGCSSTSAPRWRTPRSRPSWRPGDEFEAARKRALAELGR